MTIDPSKLSEAIALAKRDLAIFANVDPGPEKELAAVLIAAAEETLERMKGDGEGR